MNSHEIPFVKILLPYALGILVAYPFVCIQLLWTCALVCLLLFVCLGSINLYYLKLKAYLFKGTVGLAFYFFWFALGSLSCVFHQQSIKPDYFANNKGYPYLKIRVSDEPQYKNNIIRFKSLVINTYKNPSDNLRRDKKEPAAAAVSGNLMVAVKVNPACPVVLNYGDELIIKAELKEIAPPYNSSEFDYKSWLAMQNIYHQTFLKQADLIKVRGDTGNPVVAFALRLRKEQVNFYRKILKNDDAFAFASTLILGYKSELSRETMNIYAKTGTIHVLSVSGMHVGIVFAVLNWLLQFLDRKRWSMAVKMAFILSFIWFYALLTGFSPSVLRSALMISVFIVSKSFVKKTNSYNIIAFTAFILLVRNPFQIWDIGFQLSFLAVLGLIWLQPKIENWLHIKNKWLNKLWTAVAISLAAQLITYPLSVYYFHQFPVYFLISNLFILLPAALLMYLGIFLLIFRIEAPGRAFEWLINFTNSGLSKISDLPHATISGIWISKAELMMLCITLGLFILALSHYSKRLLFASLTFLLCFQSLLFMDKLIVLKQKKVIAFKIRNQISSGFICGQEITLITFEKPNERDFHYFIKPAIDQHQLKRINWILLKQE
ncbi:MAG TPA: ComEC/Rec2 family competence protein [Pedobacter sp.]|uniref:ComEC/Rec2 family competence protein n=1 Tax=Pedobacter sp. TaxID=1411316 RepID=UPI002B5C1C66|nr:ComEC/Rec2 family competence protein [Pedobacter sp.]HMI05548.1 ComEC/Rec2 family competence protein [Pedobacter sp.]